MSNMSIYQAKDGKAYNYSSRTYHFRGHELIGIIPYDRNLVAQAKIKVASPVDSRLSRAVNLALTPVTLPILAMMKIISFIFESFASVSSSDSSRREITLATTNTSTPRARVHHESFAMKPGNQTNVEFAKSGITPTKTVVPRLVMPVPEAIADYSADEPTLSPTATTGTKLPSETKIEQKKSPENPRERTEGVFVDDFPATFNYQ